MATLPAFLRRNEAQAYLEAARPPARAERDPFCLRALPHDDVFFYCKKIDNSRLVREHDERAHGACWSAIGGAAVIGVGVAWPAKPAPIFLSVSWCRCSTPRLVPGIPRIVP